MTKETFQETVDRMTAAKAEIEARQQALLEERYDMSEHAGRGRHDVARQSGAGRRAGEAAGREPAGTTWRT